PFPIAEKARNRRTCSRHLGRRCGCFASCRSNAHRSIRDGGLHPTSPRGPLDCSPLFDACLAGRSLPWTFGNGDSTLSPSNSLPRSCTGHGDGGFLCAPLFVETQRPLFAARHRGLLGICGRGCWNLERGTDLLKPRGRSSHRRTRPEYACFDNFGGLRGAQMADPLNTESATAAEGTSKAKGPLARVIDGLLWVTVIGVLFFAFIPRKSGPSLGPAAVISALPIVGTVGESRAIPGALERPLLIEAFASWCGACRRQSGLMGDLAEAQEQGKLDVLAISVDRNAQKALQAKESWPIP